ncbi:MAG: MerC domain-containing protein [Opitutales bacterium]
MARPTPQTQSHPFSARLQLVLDLGSLALAGICSVHCLLTPVLLVGFPVVGSTVLSDGHFHAWMLAAVLPLSILAVLVGCRRHKDWQVFVRLAVGLSLLTAGVILGLGDHAAGGHDHGILPLGTGLTLLGGLAMIAGHWRNFRLCRHEHCDHGH